MPDKCTEPLCSFFLCDNVKLAEIIDATADIIMFTLDRQYRYTSYSKAHKETMKKIWGGDIRLGLSIFEVMTDDGDKLRAKQSFDRCLSGENFVLREEYGDSAIDRKIWEDRYYPVRGEGAEVKGLLIVASDITDLVAKEKMYIDAQYQKKLAEERELILHSLGEGVYGVDNDGRCMFVNPAALAMLGYAECEFIGRNTHNLIHHHHYDGRPYDKEDCIIHKVTSSVSRDENRTWLFRKDGSSFPVRIIANPILKAGEVTGVVIAFSDISTQFEMEEKLRSANNDLKVLATQDHLTEIYNRRYFEERGSGLFLSAKMGGNSLSLVMFDIDFFKKINDKFGHAVGDLVLVMVTETVKTQLRKSDIFARIGGEEFAIILPDIGLVKAAEIAERIRQKVEQASIIQNGETIKCTISMGAADIRAGDEDIYGLLQRADDRQYTAKRTGRNRVVSSG